MLSLFTTNCVGSLVELIKVVFNFSSALALSTIVAAKEFLNNLASVKFLSICNAELKLDLPSLILSAISFLTEAILFLGLDFSDKSSKPKPIGCCLA